MRWNRFLTPGRVIAAGFAFLILAGTGLLLLPISHQPGQSLSFMDALFTATSGVCSTGLSSIQCNAVLSGFGQAVLLLLIQVGGMGITTLGVGIILVTGKKIGIRERTLIKESLNQPSFQGILRLQSDGVGAFSGKEIAQGAENSTGEADGKVTKISAMKYVM
mgnify:CR=1 FL=1